MKGYQAGISKFTDSSSVIFGVSTDDAETNKKFAESLNLEFALLSDPSGEMVAKYGVLNAERKMASRTTFVVDKAGKIQFVESGGDAIDPSGAASACTGLK